MKNKVNKNPLVSFCMATYKRPEFLEKTLRSILIQKYDNFEIIVSDNDPEGSGEKIVKKIKSTKIKYYKNKKNLGMMKNFIKAFSHSRGDFVTLIADDDPIEKDMLKTLINLYRNNPQFESFWGASYLYVNTKGVADAYGLKVGSNSLRSVLKKYGQISFYSPNSFFRSFIEYEIMPYFLWSNGIVKRNLVKAVIKEVDYDSPYFTDYCYIMKIGLGGKLLAINKELGGQTIHFMNHGRTEQEINLLIKGTRGFYDAILPNTKNKKDLKMFQDFIASWIVEYLISLKRFNIRVGNKIDERYLDNTFYKMCEKFAFIKNKTLEFKLRSLYPFAISKFFYYLRYTRPQQIRRVFKTVIARNNES